MDRSEPASRGGARSGGDDPLAPAPRRGPEVLTVSQLNRAVAGLIERGIPLIWVAGEISNFTRAASGHWYFTLKDATAQVRAVMFRGRASQVDFQPREGDRVEVRAVPGLYEPRGEFQLGVEQMRRAGAGDLFQRFLQLKEKLQREGLFDEARKRPLPEQPRCVGVVTSPRAAALRDVLTTLRRRAPQIPVVLYPTPVQGADAPPAIVAALRAAAERRECDVLLVVRGGGSIEDLWAFNDERVARAIAASPMPVVAGVGHETDFTIADFVADLRAPTPTGAAAAAVPDRRELVDRVSALAARLVRDARRQAQRREQRLDTAARLLRPPSAQWQQRALRLQALADRLGSAVRLRLRESRHRFVHAHRQLRAPGIAAAQARAAGAAERLGRGMRDSLADHARTLDELSVRLGLASPDNLLARGYAIVRDQRGAVVRAYDAVAIDEPLQVLLARGALEVSVRDRVPPDPGGEPAPDLT